MRVTAVQPREDPLYTVLLVRKRTGDASTPLLEIGGPEDALPFPFCISAIGSAPGCAYVSTMSRVARGNVILVDHGRTGGPEDRVRLCPAE